MRYTPRGYTLGDMQHLHDNTQKKIARRLKIIEGQVRGLSRMVENDTYCINIIAQTSAVKRALSTVEDLLLESHLNSCVRHQMTSGETGKAVKEVLKVYKLKRK